MPQTLFVIIPVYNAEAFVEAAVRSVQRNNRDNTRIVLVDDGSRDASGVLCDRLSGEDSHVHVLHQQNRGVSAARNAGIEYVFSRMKPSDSDYFAFLDADDFWDPRVKLADFDLQNADLAAFSSCLSNACGNTFRSFNRFRNEVLLLKGANTLWINDGHFGAFLFRVGLVRQFRLRFMEGVRGNEDIIFWRQATFCARKVVFFCQVLYYYRTNYASVTHNPHHEDISTLHIPRAWKNAAEWVKALSQFTPEEQQRWIRDCENTAGARLLEAARVLAEQGLSASAVEAAVTNTSLFQCLKNLDPEFLADWQKEDYFLFWEDLREFTALHRRRGMLRSLRKDLSRLAFLRTVRERFKFRQPILGLPEQQ